MSDDKPKTPLRPRNLTALQSQSYGNPASSRPESGVANCYPGLEFDVRTFEELFFPGLKFEFHHSKGALLVSLGDDEELTALVTGDSEQDRELWLWGIACENKKGVPTFLNFKKLPGIEIWDRLRGFAGRKIKIALGIEAESNPGDYPLRNAFAADHPGQAKWTQFAMEAEGWSCLVGKAERSSALDDNGLVDPDLIPPGELTKTMCAPWIFDFRDCFCFYWAANKPDIVTDATDATRLVDFMRASREDEHDEADINNWFERTKKTLSFEDLAHGAWNELPIVLGDQEVPDGKISYPAASDLSIDRARLIKVLSHLATVEHALMAEYLFAYYSLRKESDFAGPSEHLEAVMRSAKEVRRIAVDEMRHFQWVNQMLALLGASPSLARAEFILEAPDPALNYDVTEARKVEMRVLNSETLQDFLDAEQRSNVSGQGIDGLYTAVLDAVQNNPMDIEQPDVIIGYLKLIIDEGVDHYESLTQIRSDLEMVGENRYLRNLDSKPNPAQQKQLELCDIYYSSILQSIQISFSLGSSNGQALINNAVRTMLNLSDLAEALAVAGVAPVFNAPTKMNRRVTRDEALEQVDLRRKEHQRAVDALGDVDPDKKRGADYFDELMRQAARLIQNEKD